MWCLLFIISSLSEVRLASMTNPFLSTTEYFREFADLSHFYQDDVILRKVLEDTFKPIPTVEDFTMRAEQFIATVSDAN